MGIQRKDSCDSSLTFLLALAIVTTAVPKTASVISTRTADAMLIAAYGLPDTITRVKAKSLASELEKAAANCMDNYLASRITYRAGVIYFKAGMTRESKTRFLRVANDSRYPELIRACSFNMLGHVSRFQAENDEALAAFDEMADLLERHLSANHRQAPNSAVPRLLLSAVFSRAEIYELRQDHAASILEYDRLLQRLNQNRDTVLESLYAPLAMDRMSQLCLRAGDEDRYMRLTKRLVDLYPNYRRTPIIALELKCVEFLKSVTVNPDFSNGSFGSPVQAIASLRNIEGDDSTQTFVDTLRGLCEKYRNSRGGILLQYHYAWVLDSLGEKDRASKAFARVFSTNAVEIDRESREGIFAEVVREYARIQYAIMAGEKADYQQALSALNGLRPDRNESHIARLAQSVTDGIQTLRREVGKQ